MLAFKHEKSAFMYKATKEPLPMVCPNATRTHKIP